VRFGSGDPARNRVHAAEFVKLACDVVVTGGTDAARAMQERTRTTPIVIVGAADVAANGLVTNIARPESNITGFTNNYASIAGKWLQLLREAAPQVARVAVLSSGTVGFGNNTRNAYQLAIDEAAPAIGVRLVKVFYRNPVEIVRAIDAFAAEPNGGLLVLPANLYPDTIIPTAVQYRLPAIYPEREEVAAGGLLSYTSDGVERFRRAAGYVDRLLRGTAKVADLPVQYPTKYELTVNLKTARAIGLTIPEAFLLRADEVIE
jgi:putative ABC transport system substrate-binding protein